MLYDVAERVGAPLLILETTAPENVIRDRLARRAANLKSGHETDDKSTADVGVYPRMQHSAQPIRHHHITVDTSQDITPVLERIVAELQHDLKPTAPNPL